MNRFQKTILTAANSNGGQLPAPGYNLTLDQAQAYCGLSNIRAIKLARDYSLVITDEGRRVLRSA